MCHGQVLSQTIVSLPGICEGCGRRYSTGYRLRWREKGEIGEVTLCATCAEIELRRPER